MPAPRSPGFPDADPHRTSSAPPERILLVRLSALGDVVQTLPALAALRAARPAAVIGFLVEDRNAALLEGHPHVDRLFVFRRRAGALRAAAALRRELRGFRPDVAVDLQGNLKGALLARLSGAARRIGLPRGEAREGAWLLATERVAPGPPAEHRAERALRLLRPLGAAGLAEAALPEVPQAAGSAIAAALAELGVETGRYALLLPGTSDFGAFKRWPPARFGALAARLAEAHGLPVLVGYGPGQRELARAVVDASLGTARLAPETRDAGELLALLEAAAVVVGSDSGPVAMAAAAARPTVTLFGPKHPGTYAPRGPHAVAVWKRVYCSPCPLRRCADPICMTTLEPDEVHAGVLRALGLDAGAAAGG